MQRAVLILNATKVIFHVVFMKSNITCLLQVAFDNCNFTVMGVCLEKHFLLVLYERKKVKQSLYRPSRFPNLKVVRLLVLSIGRLTHPGNIPSTHFC